MVISKYVHRDEQQIRERWLFTTSHDTRSCKVGKVNSWNTLSCGDCLDWGLVDVIGRPREAAKPRTDRRFSPSPREHHGCRGRYHETMSLSTAIC